MKQYWQRMATKIDALTLRERAIIFTMAAVVLIVLANTLFIDPQYAKQMQLSDRIKHDQAKTTVLRADIQQRLTAREADPDKANRIRLQQLKQELSRLQAALHETQKGLVPPDKMPSLLKDILSRNGNLQLMSLKTLPVSGVAEAAPSSNKTAAETTAASAARASGKPESGPASGAPDKGGAEAIYRHGVEIVVQGTYLDLLDYLAQLEKMPWQLFWGKAHLKSEEYPKATLTLTLYTLSLDRKWLNI